MNPTSRIAVAVTGMIIFAVLPPAAGGIVIRGSGEVSTNTDISGPNGSVGCTCRSNTAHFALPVAQGFPPSGTEQCPRCSANGAGDERVTVGLNTVSGSLTGDPNSAMTFTLSGSGAASHSGRGSGLVGSANGTGEGGLGFTISGTGNPIAISTSVNASGNVTLDVTLSLGGQRLGQITRDSNGVLSGSIPASVSDPGTYTLDADFHGRCDAQGSSNDTTSWDFTITLSVGGGGPGELHWANAAGGDFGTATNWNPPQTPSANDTAVIDLSATFPISISTGSAAQLQIRNSVLDLLGGQLDLTGPGLASPSLSLAAGASVALDTGTINCVHAVIGDDPNGALSAFNLLGSATAHPILHSTGTLSVGLLAPGRLDVTAGQLNADQVQIVGAPGGASAVTFSGARARDSTINRLDIGIAGPATLTIQDGAALGSTTAQIGGAAAGTATVQGVSSLDGQMARSTWTGQSLTVGDDASGTLNIHDGAFLSASALPFLQVGNGTVDVAGVVQDQSAELSSTSILLGNAAQPGDLTVQNGGLVHDVSSFSIGPGAAHARGEATLSTGQFRASEIDANELDLGGRAASSDGSLEVLDGAHVAVGTAVLGPFDQGGAGSLTVRGVGAGSSTPSLFEASTRLTVGQAGSATVQISDAGRLVAQALAIGGENRGSNAILTASMGSGSKAALVVNGPAQLLGPKTQLLLFGGGGVVANFNAGLTIQPTGTADFSVSDPNTFATIVGAMVVNGKTADAVASVVVKDGGAIAEPVGETATLQVGDVATGPGDVRIEHDVLNIGDPVKAQMDFQTVDIVRGRIAVNGAAKLGAKGNLTVHRDGRLEVDSNLLNFDNVICDQLLVETGGVVRVCPNGRLRANSIVTQVGARLEGRANIVGNLLTGGAIQVGCSPGTLTVDGDYEQTADGTLEIEVAGLDPGQFDVLKVTGNATLAGKVDLQFINGFVPKPGDSVDFVQVSGTITGKLSGDTLVPAGTDPATGQPTAQATVRWDVTPDGTCRMTVTDVQASSQSALGIPGTNCGAGMCGAGVAPMLPLTLLALAFMKVCGGRRWLVRRDDRKEG